MTDRSSGGRASRSALLVVAVFALSLPVPASAGVGTPGSDGIGDSYFPRYGNGGYDVRRYALDIRYRPASNRLTGTATITAVATQDLSRFNLDFVGLQIGSLTVDGTDTTWVREHGHELVVTPPSTLTDGSTFVVRVRYGGIPKVFHDVVRGGVVPTSDGALFIGEPQSAAAWFPVNDHPRDKATYRIDLTVPERLDAISNGRLLGRAEASTGWTTWSWRENDPMASYLATAAIGRFRIDRRTSRDGIRVLDAVDPRAPSAARRSLQKEERTVRFMSNQFGAYPFDDLGGVVDRTPLGYALETQTRPVYDSRFFAGGENVFVVVHELAHQWFGDSVSVGDWQHIWLNEGFATYAEWLWADRKGRFTPQAFFNFICSSFGPGNSFWKVPPGDPGPRDLFDGAVYLRGAMTLQALRKEVGTAAFFEILRTWVQQHAGDTATTTQFIQLAETTSGMQLDSLFRAFLFEPEKPAGCSAAGGRSPGVDAALADGLMAGRAEALLP